jgi:hypothetical protein
MPRAIGEKRLVFAKMTRGIVVSPYSFEGVTGKCGWGLVVSASMANDEVRMTIDE